ncbi:TD and POZ domain-containing protein 1-like isoform X2 [Microplitis mediator]|uniref:TD and POZ domain-containing protein 1-like isoform X2 n=1 Tax=Microplitis mediator TaxID=375433 RepID=UPI0025563CE1|nr:TD and POZ domain-containing protein 1-like isoform X2 [Microplitis mediator]
MERHDVMVCKQKTIFEWKIGEFPLTIKYSVINQDAHTILSPDFPTDWKSKWQLELKFNNDKTSEDKEWISIFLNSRSGGDYDIFGVKYSLFIFDNKNEKKFKQKSYKVFNRDEKFCILKFLNVKQLLEKRDKLLPDKALTICIKLTKFTKRSSHISAIIKIPLKTSNHQIAHDLKDLFDSKAGSDVVLIVGDKKIPAHKTLLMSRSPVFFAMFTHKLKENRENEVDIPDIDPDTLADKYQIPALKELCAESFCKNVNVVNAVQYLVLLDRHHADERFFKYIMDFIEINFEYIIKTPAYKAFEKYNPKMSLALLTAINIHL